jgi:hypothetical protein
MNGEQKNIMPIDRGVSSCEIPATQRAVAEYHGKNFKSKNHMGLFTL